ncbi:hypothetical protein HMPREF3227_02148 [Corynebacterium sp. CMW7794]|uniref:Or membrane protein n=1 Tax=Corynebacterium phoceense TaxID=1686286 RepID=A0A540R9Z4_9CORY|nr:MULTISPECIES: hypothetical protein [Corynebacterium]KXB55955.1 hypothetical protein HMPREF0307_00617 [Corynebacterium sp. DNF00584]KXI15993.1 hypothetical protein HMPREF3227_02148 [Corynebacterium sp. CMW7794]MBF9010609.1 hypothetical protein [Corynebacterium phoceense]OFL78711.1 hypothetical protein HMPREF2748_11515 [Corynebacterium sp. HMSC077B05]OFN39639.1 hypothetical protein HMPREF2559_06200 [Corynebacterium sp. HMSC072G08]
MRIRNAAIAGATALAVAFGGTTVASAEDTAAPKQEQSSTANGSSTSDNKGESTPDEKDAAKGASLSSKINTGLKLEGDKEADGQKIFGSSKDLSEQPKWAKVLYGTTIATAIATLIGMVVGPLANFVQFGPFSR